MQSRAILEFSDPAAVDVRRSGGKGASLARLFQGGFAVPPGIVVPAGAYRTFHASVPGLEPLVEALALQDAARLHEQSAEIRERLVGTPLPGSLRRSLGERLPALLERGPVSVRSSATLEDSAAAAFAGQHDTYLNVHGVEAVLDAIRRCWASLWEDRAVRYRHERGFAVGAVEMAVVVQSMVQSEVAGVAFSMNPITGALDEIVVNAAYGLGETVVSGEGGVDQLVVAKGTGEVRSEHVARKTHALVGTAEGTARVELPVDRAESPALTREQCEALRVMVEAVERFYAFPQDVEWAFAGGDLFLLQSRPVTEFPPRWTRDESAERFPNPVTPLTWDFTTGGFHASLAHSLGIMGFPPFEGTWFERRDGYVYGNQTAVKLFTSGLGFRFDSLEEFAARRQELIDAYRWVQQLPVAWARDLDRYLLGLGRLGAVELEGLSLPDLWEHVLRVDALGSEYFRPNIAISITHGMLHRVLFQLLSLVAGPAGAPALYDALTSFNETKTSLVNADLHRLARLAEADPALRALLLDTERRRIVEEGRLEAHPEFARAFGRFLEDHGHREVDFDAYHPTWVGQPWTVLENVRLMLMQPEAASPEAREGELRAAQARAEREFLAEVPEELRNFAAEILRLARVYTALDDLEHYQTTRLTVPFRAALVETGRRLRDAGVLDEAEDVFFLHRATLEGLVHGRVPAERATQEAKENREAYRRQLAATPPHVWGESETAEPEGALRGLPGSPGSAEGEVCRIHGAADFARFVPGSVLVARTTNPAWTPLFYAAAAVVTESGGPLSHGAVTAREVGIPAVMAVPGALQRLPDGTRVRVDGTRGLVQLLDDGTSDGP
jgi:pyruvate,water dikinase